MHPKVSGSTSIYLVTLSTFSATLQFLLLGILPVDYTLFLSFLVIIFIILGNLVVNRIVEKVGKPSVLALFLAYVIILCTVIVMFTGFFKIYSKMSKGDDIFESSPYCEN